MRLRSLVLSAALLVLPLPLVADTVYTYTGNPFTYVDLGAPYTTSDFVSASFSVSAPLAANLVDVPITPNSYSFSNGVQSFDSSTPAIYSDFYIWTDANGDITGWSIDLDTRGYGAVWTSNVYVSYDDPINGPVNWSGPGYYGDDGAESQSSKIALNNNDPGTWTTTTDPTPIPEPSTLALLGTGLLGMAGMARRRLLSLS